MEVRLLVFLAFTCATVITNTLLAFFAYKAFAGLTSKVGKTVSDFEKNSEMREFIDSLKVAAEQAVTVTQTTKERMAEFEPLIAKAQENYTRSLAQIDSKLQNVATQIDDGAQKVRDTVAKPAFSVMAFAAGMSKVIESMQREDE